MIDAIVHHLTPDLFIVALVGHLVVESSAKIALHGARHLAYLAAVVMLPVLTQVVAHHKTAAAEQEAPRKRTLTRRN